MLFNRSRTKYKINIRNKSRFSLQPVLNLSLQLVSGCHHRHHYCLAQWCKVKLVYFRNITNIVFNPTYGTWNANQEVANHFNQPGHGLHHLRAVVLEKVRNKDPFVLKAREHLYIGPTKFDAFNRGIIKEP